MIGWVHYKPEHCKFWYNFEFDRNIVSGQPYNWCNDGDNIPSPQTLPHPELCYRQPAQKRGTHCGLEPVKPSQQFTLTAT